MLVVLLATETEHRCWILASLHIYTPANRALVGICHPVYHLFVLPLICPHTTFSFVAHATITVLVGLELNPVHIIPTV